MKTLAQLPKLPSNLVAYPDIAKAAMTTKDAKQLILAHDGSVLLRGQLYEIHAKSIGAGCQHVWLEKVRK